MSKRLVAGTGGQAFGSTGYRLLTTLLTVV